MLINKILNIKGIDIPEPTKEELGAEMSGFPQKGHYIHGKCVGDFHNNPEQRNAYMQKYNKMYRTEIESPESRKNRKAKQKTWDAKKYETYHLWKDEYNAKRRARYAMKKAGQSC